MCLAPMPIPAAPGHTLRAALPSHTVVKWSEQEGCRGAPAVQARPAPLPHRGLGRLPAALVPKPLEEDTGEEASMPEWGAQPDGQMAAVRVTGARLLFSLEPGHIPLSLSAQLPAGAACMPSTCQLTPGSHFL